jgi:hypothetical protein
MADGYVPPQAVRNNAKRGLELRKKHGRGGTAIGVARARDLSNGKALSLSTINRMVSYFARHEVDKKGEGWGVDSAGYIAWLLWGGDAGRSWANRISKENKKIDKGNPNRDGSSGRFTFGAGGSQSDGAGAGGSKDIKEGKDIKSELGRDYGQVSETKEGQRLRVESNAPGTKGDPVLDDIAKRQGFDGPTELVSQEKFDEIVAEGGTVTYRGIGSHYDGPGPSAKYIDGESAITQDFAKGDYYAGKGGYGSGTYTTGDISVAQHYATSPDNGADGAGAVVTMVVKPGAKIATPQQWQAARIAARDEKGGFMGADNEGRILAAQGFDGFRINSKDSDHFSNQFIIVLNRTAVAVLDK